MRDDFPWAAQGYRLKKFLIWSKVCRKIEKTWMILTISSLSHYSSHISNYPSLLKWKCYVIRLTVLDCKMFHSYYDKKIHNLIIHPSEVSGSPSLWAKIRQILWSCLTPNSFIDLKMSYGIKFWRFLNLFQFSSKTWHHNTFSNQ